MNPMHFSIKKSKIITTLLVCDAGIATLENTDMLAEVTDQL